MTTVSLDENQGPGPPGELVSVPDRQSRDRISVSDKIVIHPHFHIALGVSTILACQVGGVGLFGSLLTGFSFIFAALVGRNLMIQRHFRDGLYRRVLTISSRLERNAHGRDEAATWNTLQAECHLMLGNLDEARVALDNPADTSLSARVRVSRKIDLAVLQCRTGNSEAALKTISEIDLDETPEHLHPNCHLIRASALYWQGSFQEAAVTLDKIYVPTVHPTLHAGLLALRALIALDGEQKPQEALGLSKQALLCLEGITHARPGILVDHAYILLEATGDTQACLETIEGLFGHESELGPTGESVLHYLLAKCYQEVGLFDEARTHARQAQDLPSSHFISFKLDHLVKSLDRLPMN